MTTTVAPLNGATGIQAEAGAAPKTDTASGPQVTPRGSDGKFQPKETVPETPPKPKIRIKDLEMDEDAAWAEVQRGRQSTRLLTEAGNRARAAEAREKQLDERRTRYRDDLQALVEDLDLSPEEAEKLAASWLHKHRILPSQMTEEQRRIAQLEEQIAKRAASDKESVAAKSKADADAASRREEQSLQEEILAAAQAGKLPGVLPGAPGAAAAVRRIASWMARVEGAGGKLSAVEAAALSREDVGRETGEFVNAAEVDELRALWGERPFRAHVKRVLAWAMAQVKTGQPANTQHRPAAAPMNGERRALTPQEFLEKHRR